MSNIDKRALRKAAMHAKTEDDWGCDADNFHDKATPDAVLALLDELEAAEKRIAELEAEKETLRPVGVMSEGAFRRLENSESRFIALWPRPGIYLPRKRPDDGVIVYARTAAGIGVKGE
ncbi:ead/Ea22-like family protein [Citrobacter freundii]|uniref:ead/Ea22-like family protein n=1 Tax=Citrobacter freundii TaxID=546 RepID=UPI0015C47328|nr:ead/Ea22-like family protein [Citrobacter freundii]ELN4557090.1 ead/Ea22-like family protein [Citrobacter freundii]NWO36323.1 ead/Ea22-like family protein [Citrobacter freundii]HDG1657263.1 ead/Ea22-like family protein [Citrobacter freundii]